MLGTLFATALCVAPFASFPQEDEEKKKEAVRARFLELEKLALKKNKDEEFDEIARTLAGMMASYDEKAKQWNRHQSENKDHVLAAENMTIDVMLTYVQVRQTVAGDVAFSKEGDAEIACLTVCQIFGKDKTRDKTDYLYKYVKMKDDWLLVSFREAKKK